MKVTIVKKEEDVKLGDLVVSYLGSNYIVSQKDNGKFTLYDLQDSKFVNFEYSSIEKMIKEFFREYTHHPKDSLELLVKAGNK